MNEIGLIVLLVLVPPSLGANILVMLPLSAKSHVHNFMPLFTALADRGHNMTVVSSYVDIPPRANWTTIPFINPKEYFVKRDITHPGISGPGQLVLSRDLWFIANSLSEDYKKSLMQIENGDIFDPREVEKLIEEIMSKFNKNTLLSTMWDGYLNLTETLLKDGIIQNLVDDNMQYDLMISETLYQQEPFIVFSHIYGIPVINIDAHFPSSWSCFLTGNLCPSSFIPNYKSSFSDQMNYFERIENSFMNLKELLGTYFYYLPKQEQLIRKYFKHPRIESLPPLLNLLRKASLTLVDSHFSQSYPRPYLPNIVEVGGLTINDNTTIDKDLENYMNESRNGVIYFTFGTSIPLSMIPKKVLNTFVTAFGSLKQNIIMRWNADYELPNKSSNVMTLKWAPQNGILAHPNCLLFISHGGIHSLTESMYHGVPLLLFPFVSDQAFNAKFAEKNGIGYVIDRDTLTTEEVLTAINEVLTNPSYKRNMMKKSLIIKDKPLTPLDTAIYWVEYVLRHNGAQHLRPSTIDMTIYEYIIQDIGLIGALVSFVLLAIFGLFFTFIINGTFKK